jgi:hypothetical protein
MPRGLKAMQVYPMTRFLLILQSLAKKRMEFDDSKKSKQK